VQDLNDRRDFESFVNLASDDQVLRVRGGEEAVCECVRERESACTRLICLLTPQPWLPAP
jgi:hypothetical protein